MYEIDQAQYYATIDSPGGPIVVLKPKADDNFDHIARDEDGNPTFGGKIGQYLGSLLLLGMFLYFWFAV